MPLFGILELGNIFKSDTQNPDLDAAFGGHNVTYIQLYLSMVKAMEQRVPLQVRPHLLTYLLMEGYVSSKDKFQWEVDSNQTKHEVMEACHPTVPFDARLEMVVTEDDAAFLASINHRR